MDDKISESDEDHQKESRTEKASKAPTQEKDSQELIDTL